jgi:pimeloyl-ACP methyl ester carboxylesterase
MLGDDRTYLSGIRPRRLALGAIAGVLVSVAVVSSAIAAVPVIQTYMPSFGAPETPAILNQVGVIKIGSPSAKNVLVLEPGTSAGGGYFVPFAKWLVEHTTGWQVWSVERRENLLEDQSVLTAAKLGLVSPQQLYDYYLGYLTNPSITVHFNPVPESSVGFARQWGMNVAVEDLHRVIEAAKALGGKVVLGGHSLGGSVVTAYATWDFGGQPGADGLSGLVYDDGGSFPISSYARKTAKEETEAAQAELTRLSKKSPWLAFGGIEAPYLGLFSALGSTLTVVDPKGESLLEKFPFLPPELRSSITPVTNEAGFGYSVNYLTSPPSLIAAQIHGGKGVEAVAEADGLHGWNGEGALTPVRRYAEMLSGTGLLFADGTEWYFPERLTIDTGAVADGIENPAQEVLGLHAIYGKELPKSLKILAIDTELDKLLPANTLEGAVALANLSGIPLTNLTLINEEEHYSHNDPAGAFPNNEFFNHMVPFLEGIAP